MSRGQVRIASILRDGNRREGLLVRLRQPVAKLRKQFELHRRHCDCRLFFVNQCAGPFSISRLKKTHCYVEGTQLSLAEVGVDVPIEGIPTAFALSSPPANRSIATIPHH